MTKRFRPPALPAFDTGDKLDQMLELGRITVSQHRAGKAWREDHATVLSVDRDRERKRCRSEETGTLISPVREAQRRFQESKAVIGRHWKPCAGVVLYNRDAAVLAEETGMSVDEVRQALVWGLTNLARGLYNG